MEFTVIFFEFTEIYILWGSARSMPGCAAGRRVGERRPANAYAGVAKVRKAARAPNRHVPNKACTE
jgi:hypothetical protein